jgi:glycosyltransferase involved in cell wall biosynthesis
VIVNFAFPSSRHRVGGVTMLYEFANALARRGHEVHFAHGPAWPQRIDRLDELSFRFDERVQQHIVDTLDDPSLPPGDVVFAEGAPRLGQPVVVVQGFRLSGPYWDRIAFRALAPKICVASWLVEVGAFYGVPDEQLVHVPLGLDHELFAVRTPPHERSIDVAMLYHPFPEKGWGVGREALEELARRRPGLRAVVFSMAGEPPESLPDGVQVVVVLDQRRLADEVYNAARVVVQSSRHEGFGLTAVEGMACGAALVTTDCGGSRDYAFPGETACVVAAGDVSGLADCTEALLRDDDRRNALAAAGARYVRRFDWARSGELLEAFLERYLTDPASFQRLPGEDRSEEYVL